MSNKKNKIYVAMSGGVDSSVAALLLKNEGHDVTGVHMICWEGCENNQDKQDAMRVAAKIGIPFLVWDFKKKYKKTVFDYMVGEYAAGHTPNPDVMCNKKIKFGIFLERALEAGADFIATGHYVRNLDTECPLGHSVSKLSIARDNSKDQSYFLWTLTQDQLAHSLFPVGDYLKSDIRKMAEEFGLPTAKKKDSQGLCFVGKVDFGEFIRGELPKTTGYVLDSQGKKIGVHDGAQFYTLGQRHGLGIGGSNKPLYVAEKNVSSNTLVMAMGMADPLLYKKELFARNINWINGCEPEFPLSCLARIRYRQPLQKCRIELQNKKGQFQVAFDAPQRAISPGQSVVFYDPSSTMLGGAIIEG